MVACCQIREIDLGGQTKPHDPGQSEIEVNFTQLRRS